MEAPLTAAWQGPNDTNDGSTLMDNCSDGMELFTVSTTEISRSDDMYATRGPQESTMVGMRAR